MPTEQRPPRRPRRRLYEETPVDVPPAAPELDDHPAPAPAAVGKEADALRIVKKHVYWAAGLGFLPIPVIGVASVVAIQIKMLRELSTLYGVPFSEHRGKALIATLAGGLGSIEIGRPLLSPLLAAMLPIGWPVVLVASSTAASASTYAIGRVFTHHFELGGTLLNFRAEDTRAFFEASRKP